VDPPPEEQLSLEGHETLDTLCDTFEEKLWKGELPDLAGAVSGAPDEHPLRHILVVELVQMSLEHGRPEIVDNYLKGAVDGYREIVTRTRDRFYTREETAPDTPLPNPKSTPVFPPTSRFEELRKIGSGGMGVVYEVFDRDRKLVVALKTLRSPDGNSVLQFKQEFRALADLNHPNLVQLFELFQESPCWFFTMEHVTGTDILSCSRKHPGPVADLVRPLFRQLAHGLSTLHSRGKLHRDIKPSNLLVGSDGDLKILDFGLVSDWYVTPPQTGWFPGGRRTRTLVGTPDYMAPEQLAGEPLSPASDWYSAGVVLFELLTGKALDPNILPDKELAKVADLPYDLRYLCNRLLKPSPESRPTSADVLKTLGGIPSSQARFFTRTDVWSADVFVGRKSHLKSLDTLQAEVEAGRPAVGFVSGRSGLGKSSLVRHYLAAFKKDLSCLVLESQCFAYESVQFPGIDGLIDEIVRHLRTLPPARRASVVPVDAGHLLRVFPVLESIPELALAQRDTAFPEDPLELRRRAIGALRDIFTKLARHSRLFILIDDFQWSGEDSPTLLREFLQQPPPCLFLITCRTEHPHLNRLAEQLKMLVEEAPDGKFKHLTLNPLDRRECGELVTAISDHLGRPHPRSNQVDVLTAESGGHPYLLTELLAAIGRQGSGGVGKGGIIDVLGDRVKALPTQARRLLETVSISSVPLEARRAYQASRLQAFDLRLTKQLEKDKLITCTTSGTSGILSPNHDAVRTAVEHMMTRDEFRLSHLNLAETLRGTDGEFDDQTIAHHLEHGGELQMAAHYYASAARKATEKLAFERAALYHQKRLEIDRGLGNEGRLTLKTALADALENAGKSFEAAVQLESVGRSLPENEQLEPLRRAALLYCSSGHHTPGLELFKELLKRHRLNIPEQDNLSIITHPFWLQVSPLRPVHREAPSKPLLEKIDLISAAAIGFCKATPSAALRLQARGAALALRCGDPEKAAQCLALTLIHSVTYSASPPVYTARLLKKTEELCGGSQSPYLRALHLTARGICSSHRHQFTDAAKDLEAAEQLFTGRCRDVWWELTIARTIWLSCLCRLGRIAQLQPLAYRFLEDARQRGDVLTESTIQCYSLPVALLARDRPNDARETARKGAELWGGTTNPFPQVQNHLITRVMARLYTGDGTGAWELLQDNRALVRHDGSITLWFRDLQATTALASLTQAHARAHSRMFRRARRAIRNLYRTRSPLAGPLATLRGGGLLLISGRDSPALQKLKLARDQLQEHGLEAHTLALRHLLSEYPGGDTPTSLEEAFGKHEIRNPRRWRRTILGM